MNSADAEFGSTTSLGNFVELLPPEVTYKIFSQLDIHSLCRASETSWSWNRAIKNHDALWKPHCLTARAVCQREIDDDIKSGYTWRVSLTFKVCRGFHRVVLAQLRESCNSAWRNTECFDYRGASWITVLSTWHVSTLSSTQPCLSLYLSDLKVKNILVNHKRGEKVHFFYSTLWKQYIQWTALCV